MIERIDLYYIYKYILCKYNTIVRCYKIIWFLNYKTYIWNGIIISKLVTICSHNICTWTNRIFFHKYFISVKWFRQLWLSSSNIRIASVDSPLKMTVIFVDSAWEIQNYRGRTYFIPCWYHTNENQIIRYS